jgi:hypothetical protein
VDRQPRPVEVIVPTIGLPYGAIVVTSDPDDIATGLVIRRA